MSKRVICKLGQDGFTLIELVIVIVVLGIVAAVAVPRFTDMSTSARINATRSEMSTIIKAIVGNPEVVSGGEYIDRGFEGDIGAPPTNLADLIVKPDSLASYDRIQRLGWNGPYLKSNDDDYLRDAWGNAYLYYPATRQLVSTGGDNDTIEMIF